MIGRIVRSADFERLLRVSPRARSQHFSVHHVADVSQVTANLPATDELSTAVAGQKCRLVDELPLAAPAPGPRHRLGVVVPKRHARRSVTRTLLKRQMRAAVERHAADLPAGCWVLRLKAPFDRTAYRSAASDGLRDASRQELDRLLAGLHGG